jgi:hypothetical protein
MYSSGGSRIGSCSKDGKGSHGHTTAVLKTKEGVLVPSSFSRFLSEEELVKVRALYLESLKEEGMTDPAGVAPKPSPDESALPTVQDAPNTSSK